MIVPQKDNMLKRLREAFWDYPNQLFGEGALLHKIYQLYMMLRPFSHIFIYSLLFFVLGFLVYTERFALAKSQKDTLIEGVVIGDSTLSRINPLIPTNNQLELDLSSLIYYPLLRVDAKGEPSGVLALSWEDQEKKGEEYLFHLRDNVYWHDGEKFTSDDVIATFEVLKSLGEEGGGIISRQVELSKKVEIFKVDNYTLAIKVKEILPTFFEDLTFGILPKHILDEVSLSTFSWAKFNLQPVGTGPYILRAIKDDVVMLQANSKFYGDTPQIQNLHIRMFETGDDAVEALKNGDVHSLVNPSTAIINELSEWKNLQQVSSAVLYKRYFAMYFNMKKGGPQVLSNMKVRQAISSTINRDVLIEKVESAGSEAMGPIPEVSWAYSKEAVRYRYDLDKAKKILKESGWEEKEVGGKFVRMKDEDVLRFDLSYLDKYDRQILAESIKSDLESLGIIVNLDPRSASDLNEALIATRNFDTVLYGVETPIDPDRIRLWHSEAIEYPGLNISSYSSGRTGAVIGEEQDLERISFTDAALENARTTLDRDRRTGKDGLSIGYYKFQEILLEECPAVFLYHPVFSYVVHSRVDGVDLSGMTVPEDRYLSVVYWKIN